MSLKMNHSRFWSVFCAILFLGSCAEPELTLDKEFLSFSESSVFSNDLTVDDLLKDGAPKEFRAAVATMLNNPLGKKVCQFIKKSEPFIYFVPYLDENGEILREPAMLLYAGYGKIYYTAAALGDDGLLFHEFFHMYQTGEIVVKCRNNEVEAYLAQYFYLKQINRVPWIIDEDFTRLIVKLASYIDPYTGYAPAGADMEQFKTDYNAALDYLRNMPMYSGEGWFEDINMLYNNPFPRLRSLLIN